MEDKEIMIKVLNSYIEDLKAGRKPKVLEIFKKNPDLAEAVAPLIHIVRLSMIKEGTIKTTELDPAKSKKLSEELVGKIKKLRNNKQEETYCIRNFLPAFAFRKNDEEQEKEDEDYTTKAIERLRKRMKDSDSND